jgi:hypothetical protein
LHRQKVPFIRNPTVETGFVDYLLPSAEIGRALLALAHEARG